MKLQQWIFPQIDATQSKQLGLPPLVVRILQNRGRSTPEQIMDFLGQEEQLGDPFLLCDMDKAVERIQLAIEEEQSITVYGDYDCDGMVSTVLLYSYLEAVGARVNYYIPSRKNEGYGLNVSAIERIRQSGTDLLITVDNGISAIEEIDYANRIGLDVIVTDHHKPRETLPDALAVVNPHRADDVSGCTYLAGVGVAFKLICALEDGACEEMLEQYGDLVSVATVGDIVPLVGENRTIVKYGLGALENTMNVGLQALLKVCGLEGKKLSGENIAYGIVPRINAAGRFDETKSILELLLTEDDEYALELAQEINALNDRRKNLEAEIVQQIEHILVENPELLSKRALLFQGENWNNGVIGIVAAKMMQRFGKPCILFSIDGEEARGSGRSIDGFSIIDAISGCAGLLTQYGGHSMAAGLSLASADVTAFIDEFLAYTGQNYDYMPISAMHIDHVITVDELTVPNIDSLSMLEPFGCGNDVPLFCIKKATVQGITPIGNGKHLRLRFQTPQGAFYAVYFGMTPQRFVYQDGDVVDIAVSIDINEYNGQRKVSVKIRDVRFSNVKHDEQYTAVQIYDRFQRGEPLSDVQKKQACPSRDELGDVYRTIRSCKQLRGDARVLHARMGSKAPGFCKVRFALDILSELSLIAVTDTNEVPVIALAPGAGKVDLSTSEILQSLQ